MNAALEQFSTTTGVNISYDPQTAQGQRSSALQGRYTVDAGLRQLLAGTRLEAVRLGNGSYSLVALTNAAVQLSPTAISGQTVAKSNNGDQGNRPATVPEHMASAWLNYTVHDTALNGLSLGAGVHYTGVLYGDNANTYHIDNYTLFDAGASYPLNNHVTVSVNAQNLLDTQYVASCDDSYECYPGMRRPLLTSVKYSW